MSVRQLHASCSWGNVTLRDVDIRLGGFFLTAKGTPGTRALSGLRLPQLVEGGAGPGGTSWPGY